MRGVRVWEGWANLDIKKVLEMVRRSKWDSARAWNLEKWEMKISDILNNSLLGDCEWVALWL